jgi:DNA adenine methylase
VACGDWSRVCGPSVRRAGGAICGVFLDPPYDLDMRASVYTCETPAAREAMEWAAANGNEPGLRIVLAGYDGEHNDLESKGWRVFEWKTRGGYGSQGDGRGAENRHRERLWVSPHCLRPDAPDLFSSLTETA